MIPQEKLKSTKLLIPTTLLLLLVGGVLVVKKQKSGTVQAPDAATLSQDKNPSERSIAASVPTSKQAVNPALITPPSATVGGGSSAPVSGVTTTAPSLDSTTQAQTNPAAPEVIHNCFTVSYSHKPLPSHSDEESCSQHKNLIKLKHSKVNIASLCVRVNDTPVRYQWVKGKSDEVLIGAIAGPKSVITARYCTGKHTCNEECKVPRDEFMDAIGGSDDDAPTGKVAHWEATDTAERDSQAVAKLEADLKKELDGEEGTSVFQGWISGSEAPACERMPASKQVSAPKAGTDRS